MELTSRAYLAGALLPGQRATSIKLALLASVCAPALFGASLVASHPAAAACTGPGAPSNTQTKCLTAVQIPGNPLQSFDISFVGKERDEYYLGDRANAGIDVINTNSLAFARTITGGTPACKEPDTTPCKFAGIKLNTAGTAINNNISGPDGVASHGRWVYAGDGNSTLKVIDLNIPGQNAIVQSVSTGGTTRVDEMALTTDGKLLLAANNAEDPPFATLFNANGDNGTSNVTKITKISVDPTIIPPGFGLSLEQPAWDPETQRFYTSIPIIANNPPGCNYGQMTGTPTPPITCDGGLLVTDPTTLSKPTAVQGAFDPGTNTGVVNLHACGPNGSTVGPHDNLLLGCTPGNNPSDTTTLVINAKTKNYANIANITGSDEVWFNKGDRRYYLGASKAIKPAGSPLGSGAVLGVVDRTSVLIETIPQSSNSHSVAADSEHNYIFVPQVCTATGTTCKIGGDTNTTAGSGSPTVGQQICGTTNGCVAVYEHKVDHDEDRDDRRAER
jgi:hypothetical protein